jgi:hypothetical protein
MSVVTFSGPPQFGPRGGQYASSRETEHVLVYGVGGGGDIAAVCAYIFGLDGTKDAIAVGAGYSVFQYLKTLSKPSSKGSRQPEDCVDHEKWLEECFSNYPPTPLYWEVRPASAGARRIWRKIEPSADFKYGTGLDEYYVRQAFGLDIPMCLVHTAANDKGKLTFENEVSVGEAFARDLAHSRESIEALVSSVEGRNTHVLIDVGGDVVDASKGGRDYNLMLNLFETLASMGSKSPEAAIVVFGLGADGHALPHVVHGRLSSLGFEEATDELWDEYARPFLAGLEAESNKRELKEMGILGDASRATQLFLDARDGKLSSFDINSPKSIFNRTEVKGNTELKADWEEALSPKNIDNTLFIMRKVFVCKVPSGGAAHFFDKISKM